MCYGAFKSIEFTRNCQTWWLESIGMMTTIISYPIAGPWAWFGLFKLGNLYHRAFKSIEFTRKRQMWWFKSIGMMTTKISNHITCPWGWFEVSK